MLEKEFVKYNEALALKELGFDEPCFYYYVDNKLIKNLLDISNKDCDSVDNQCLAPTYSTAFRWFRDKHNLYHEIKPSFSYIVSGSTRDNSAHMFYYENKNSYEEAELACLKKLIEIVKNK
jgi:hypothetical protein